MLTKSGVKLPDFGLAKSIAPVTPQSGTGDVSDRSRNISEIWIYDTATDAKTKFAFGELSDV